MPRHRKIEGYSVEVEPKYLGYRPDEEQALEDYRQACNGILDQIKRHVDGVGNVTVINHAENVCEYCGAPWTEDSAEFNGGCCDKDMEHEPGVDTEESKE